MTKGQQFGEWTVLHKADKPYYYTCQCSCGETKDVNASTLRLGKSKSCGHVRTDSRRKKSYKESDKKMIGQRFGRLVVKKRVNQSGQSRYLCQCDCGNQTIVRVFELSEGKTRSCGCLRREMSKKSFDSIEEKGRKLLKESYVENTSLTSLNQKTSKNNKSGIKGVNQMKSGKYRAYINLKRKQHHLGVFDTLEEAEKARKEAEKELYKPIIKRHKKHTKISSEKSTTVDFSLLFFIW